MSGGRLSYLLREAADEVPGYDVLEDAIARGRRRRRRAAAVATVATVAVVATPVLLLRPQPPPPQAAPSPTTPSPSAPVAETVGATVDPHAADRPDFYFTVAAGPVAAYEIRLLSVTPDHQSATVVPAGGGEPVAQLTLYQAGADPRSIPWTVPNQPAPFADPDAEPNAQVNGSPAFVAMTAQWSGVLWRYAPDAIAVVRSAGAELLPEQALIEIAQAVRFVDPYPARVPFRLDYLPDHLPLYVVSTDPSLPAGGVQFISFDDNNPGAMDIKVSTDPDSFLEINPEYQEWDWQPATIAGRDGRCVDLIDGRRCEVFFGEVIVGFGTGGLTSVELDQIIAGLRVATLDDPATWYDIDDAIPGL